MNLWQPSVKQNLYKRLDETEAYHYFRGCDMLLDLSILMSQCACFQAL